MPGSWDPEIYRARARQWRDSVVSMPDGEKRKAYVSLAEGYERLADILGRDRGLIRPQTGRTSVVQSTVN